MTQISELQSGQGNVNVEGTIKEVGEVRTFNKYGKELKVVNAVLQDNSGSVKLTLWNNDAMIFNEGDKAKVVNGYVGEFQGEKQLTAGKYGKLEKVENEEGGEGSEESAESMEGSVDESNESEEESSAEGETSNSGDNSGNEEDNTEEKKQESESEQQPAEEPKGVEDY